MKEDPFFGIFQFPIYNHYLMQHEALQIFAAPKLVEYQELLSPVEGLAQA